MSDPLPFTPVPVRARRDGWTPDTQGRFVAELARTRNVAAACRLVGRSWQTAYRLRARPDAAGFAAAWDAALARPALPHAFTGRAIGGSARPITWRGAQVGERRRFDDRLAQYILRVRAPERYGVAREERGTGAPDPAAGLADALAVLRRELAAGIAPCDGAGPFDDAARTSSPSARRAPSRHGRVRDAPARPAAPAQADPPVPTPVIPDLFRGPSSSRNRGRRARTTVDAGTGLPAKWCFAGVPEPGATERVGHWTGSRSPSPSPPAPWAAR